MGAPPLGEAPSGEGGGWLPSATSTLSLPFERLLLLFTPSPPSTPTLPPLPSLPSATSKPSLLERLLLLPLPPPPPPPLRVLVWLVRRQGR